MGSTPAEYPSFLVGSNADKGYYKEFKLNYRYCQNAFIFCMHIDNVQNESEYFAI